MNLKDAVRHRLRGHAGNEDVNLTAVMNIFLILIPFLLLTASFVRLAVLEMTLPDLERAGRQSSILTGRVVVNVLFIRENSIQLKSPEISLAAVPKVAEYDWEALRSQLEQVKFKYPESMDVIITPESTIRYEIIIAVMDICRDAGFPNLSISG
ncbi:MAG: hypothetical protein EHM72_01820 [Calditrichaeota bacterium]|nr:MAG: hypothetical protein EHM72_01820 [Calditrichota bacterium]